MTPLRAPTLRASDGRDRRTPGRALPAARRLVARRVASLCALTAALTLPGAALGQAGGNGGATSAGECCLEASYSLSARVLALQGAVAADTASDMILANPAGMAGLARPALLVHYRKLYADGQLLGVSFVGGHHRWGTFAASYTLADGGTMPRTDSLGNEMGTIYYQAHVLQGSFATTLGAGLAVGLTYKVYVMVFPCPAPCEPGGSGGATPLLDAGVQYHPRWSRWLGVGVGLTNAGLPLQVVNYEQSDAPPARVRAGATYEVLHLLLPDTTVRGRVSAQVEAGRPHGPIPALAAEVSFGGVVALRAGWRGGRVPGEDTGGAIGLGLTLQRYAIAVARPLAAVSDAGEPAPIYVTFQTSF